MKSQLLVDRLKSQCSLLKDVGGAADFAAAQEGLRNKTPSAFVVPLAENAARNSSATLVVRQLVTQQFAVILAVSNLKDSRGEKALNDLDQVREQVFEKILGWAPPGTDSVMEFSGGRLLEMDNQVVWWQDDYMIDIQRRSV